ncbi:CaiB/BaiF CoA transferase family protein [Xanthobacter sediminis]
MTGTPLAGVRVLDLTRILAGPWATQLMADLGADVIKIERPQHGDDTRGWGPPFVTGDDGSAYSAYFLSANRGKKSVAVDFATAEGREIIAALAAGCDVFIENFKAGEMERAELDYTTLAKANPRLVYCSITGFGQSGPHSRRPGYDLLVQAMGGLMSITGMRDGEPVKAGVAVADILTGLYATVAILAALREREASGMGQHVDLALLDVQIATLANQAMNFLVSGKVPGRHGNAHPNIVPYQSFAVRDGHVVIAVGNDAQFARLAGVLGLDRLAADPRFALNTARVVNRAALIPLLTERIAGWCKADLLARLDAERIPAGPINGMDQVFEDPQAAARGLIVGLDLEGVSAPVRAVGNPIRFSRSTISNAIAPQPLGTATAEVLRERIGLDDARIESLSERGIIKTR